MRWHGVDEVYDYDDVMIDTTRTLMGLATSIAWSFADEQFV